MTKTTTTLKTPRRYATRGWTLVSTGGNCVALERRLASGKTLLATAGDDTGLAPYCTANVVLGLYGSDHSEPLKLLQTTYREFLQRTALAWFAVVEGA